MSNKSGKMMSRLFEVLYYSEDSTVESSCFWADFKFMIALPLNSFYITGQF